MKYFPHFLSHSQPMRLFPFQLTTTTTTKNIHHVFDVQNDLFCMCLCLCSISTCVTHSHYAKAQRIMFVWKMKTFSIGNVTTLASTIHICCRWLFYLFNSFSLFFVCISTLVFAHTNILSSIVRLTIASTGKWATIEKLLNVRCIVWLVFVDSTTCSPDYERSGAISNDAIKMTFEQLKYNYCRLFFHFCYDFVWQSFSSLSIHLIASWIQFRCVQFTFELELWIERACQSSKQSLLWSNGVFF